MSWYKRAQKIPTMENIIWAVDKIIAEQYGFSVEELQQASQGISSGQEYMQVAAQVATKTKPRAGYPRSSKTTRIPIGNNKKERKILELFNKGKSTPQISKSLNIPSPEIALVLKNFIGSKGERDEYLKEKHEKNILDTTNELSEEMRGDFNIFSISPRSIGDILNVDSSYVSMTLKNNKINLNALKTERRDRMAIEISTIVKDLGGVFERKDMMNEFRARHNFTLSNRSLNSALKLGNMGIKNQNDPTTIIKAFNIYVDNYIKGGRKALIQNPSKLSVTIDRFFIDYGNEHGFAPPIEKEVLRRSLLMTKIQLRDYTTNLTRNAPPAVTDQTHPSYFLNNQEEQNELV